MENKNLPQVQERKQSVIATISNKKLLESYSPANCLRVYRNISLEVAINSKSVSLSEIRSVKGRDFTEALVMIWLAYLNKLLNLNKPMPEDQIELCSIEITNQYGALKISDLTLIFKRIISGQYGELYESISIPKVLKWFSDYFDERCNHAEQLSLRQHYEDSKSLDSLNYSSSVERIWQGAKGFNSKE